MCMSVVSGWVGVDGISNLYRGMFVWVWECTVQYWGGCMSGHVWQSPVLILFLLCERHGSTSSASYLGLTQSCHNLTTSNSSLPGRESRLSSTQYGF